MLSLVAFSVLALLLVVFDRQATAASRPGPYEIVPAAVNLDSLRASLRETDAIGFTTKLSLRYDLDSLLESFDDYHKGRGVETLPSLHQKFAELLASTLSLLRQDDPQLFRKLRDAQEQLWLIVSDPVKFQAAVSAAKKNRTTVRPEG